MSVTLTPERTTQITGARAAALARRFERANDALIAAIARHPELGRTAPGPGWSAVAEARRVAEGHLPLAGFVAALGAGRPLPALPPANTHDRAPDAEGDAAGTPQVLDLLRRNGSAAGRILRGLGDQQLEAATSCFGTRLTAAQLVDELLIAPIDELVSGIDRSPHTRAALAPAAVAAVRGYPVRKSLLQGRGIARRPS
jgi:hypothetical protein